LSADTITSKQCTNLTQMSRIRQKYWIGTTFWLETNSNTYSLRLWPFCSQYDTKHLQKAKQQHPSSLHSTNTWL